MAQKVRMTDRQSAWLSDHHDLATMHYVGHETVTECSRKLRATPKKVRALLREAWRIDVTETMAIWYGRG